MTPTSRRPAGRAGRVAGRAGRVAGAPLLIACLILLSACVGGAGQQSPGTSRPSGLGRYYQQQIAWHPCGGGFECGKLTVPLDYDRPGWKDIELAVIRLPASQPSRRVGSLVVNPGGPGASGVRYVRRQAKMTIPQEVRGRFDVVGFDPRGVAGSAPVQCASAEQLDRYLALDVSPNTGQERETLVRASRRFAQGCERRSGTLLPYVGTVNAARDMDVLRAALGEEGLTYLGFSYGTLLGAYYAELFPRNVRALVLDGAVDPSLRPLRMIITQAKGFETALRSFVSDCVGRSQCPLGSDLAGGMDRLEKFFAAVDQDPLPVRGEDDRRLTQALAKTGMAAALYDKRYWPLLRQALRSAFAGDGTVLLALADALHGRQADGTYTNLVEAFTAISCVDEPMPERVGAYARAAERADRVAPHFGEFNVWSSAVCAPWPVPADEKVRVDGAGAPPILVIGTTRDPATPYAWARALAKQLESGVLLTRKGDGHTAYGQGNACIDRAVNRYLIEANPPPPDTVCG